MSFGVLSLSEIDALSEVENEGNAREEVFYFPSLSTSTSPPEIKKNSSELTSPPVGRWLPASTRAGRPEPCPGPQRSSLPRPRRGRDLLFFWGGGRESFFFSATTTAVRHRVRQTKRLACDRNFRRAGALFLGARLRASFRDTRRAQLHVLLHLPSKLQGKESKRENEKRRCLCVFRTDLLQRRRRQRQCCSSRCPQRRRRAPSSFCALRARAAGGPRPRRAARPRRPQPWVREEIK